MRFRNLVPLLILSIGFLAGCGGRATTKAVNHSVAGDWTGTFTKARLAGATEGQLDISYTESGNSVSGSAHLTVAATPSTTASYEGTLTGTNTNGNLDATITFSPELPGAVATVHIAGTVANGSFTGDYTAGTETGAVSMSHFTQALPVIPVGSIWLGTMTDVVNGQTQHLRIFVAAVDGIHFSGTFSVETQFNGAFEGTQIGNNSSFSMTTMLHSFFVGSVVDGKLSGTWVNPDLANSHGTYEITNQSAG
ncbi:hypothetical protein [Fimbriimonas ginsengisoli]|uniref:Lipoprotein n=1 Tax=Fimbriimonas ginsengisoli Gsoil 348 TaxID=661478 RepID=A0A068NSV2_FIMGI|nr:hypothetical protein [Fimbriimonas ginsengisoli]AIE85855.1 hypothetical protein OP10G_2487 [Fimbriimonas ginsengisoli Gsoil 348]